MIDSHVPISPKEESWTEEKHMHFLNSMEAWFVRTMLENNDRFNLRLDRHLPDTCDSTLDCKRNVHRRMNHNTSGFVGKMKVRPHKRSRSPSQDQIMPQIKSRREDKYEKDSPNLAC